MQRKDGAEDAVEEMTEDIINSHDCNGKKLIMTDQPNVRWISTKGGDYFVFNHINDSLKYRGIVNEHTTPYSPESNGKDENINR